MKYIYITIATILLTTACDNDLDQNPPKNLEANALTNFTPVLFAAYHYQTGASTPLVVMGDFRADNMLMREGSYVSFDTYDTNLGGGELSAQFFSPFYSNLYKAILSANTVILKSSNSSEVAEAKFIRAISYFKLVMVFGNVPVILTSQPDITQIPNIDLTRQPVANIYDNIIIPDLQDVIDSPTLLNTKRASGRASQIAARAFLGKVHLYRGDFPEAANVLGTVLSTATGAGVTLETNFANVVTDTSKEILFATKFSTSVTDLYGFTEFDAWFRGADTKSPTPLDPRLTAAFDANAISVSVSNTTGADLRKALTINVTNKKSVKYLGGLEQDHIEMRLSDVILMYAEALNESTNSDNTQSATILTGLNAIRTRAGLNSLSGTATTQADVRTAIQNERRVELALEGHRWFDLVRTNQAMSVMGFVNPNYYLFPIPNSEILASNNVITQNSGY